MKGLCCLAVAIAALLTFTGCDDPAEREPSWSYIHAAVIAPNCATSNCHSNLGSSAIGTAAAGLQLDSRDTSYWLLVGSPCDGDSPDGTPPRNFVAPFDPEASRLMYLLRGVEVDRMPPDLPLPAGEIELVEQWILEGAPCN